MEAGSSNSTARAPAPGRLLLVQEFINTYDVEMAQDGLSDLATLEGWLRERGLLAAGAAFGPGDLARARAFREALRDLIDEHGDASRESAIRTLNSLSHRALLAVSLDADGAPRLTAAADGLDGAFAELLAVIERADHDGTWRRLKACAQDSCRWAFYDHSKNRSGSWCTMAVCGNRAKARSYRARRRSAGGGDTG